MKKKTRIALLVLWIAVILLLTAYPSIPAPRIKQFPIDKVYHFLLFFIFGVFARPLLKPLVYFGLGAALIMVAEFQQLFIPGRAFEVMDMAAGAVGLCVYYLVSMPKRSMKNDLSKA